MTPAFRWSAVVVASLLAVLADPVSASLLRAPAPRGDAASAWIAIGRPTEGVHTADGWIISSFSQPVDPASKGFESVEIAACKQEAVLQLLLHCAGDGSVADSLASPIREVVENAFMGWYSGKVMDAGTIWIEAERRGDRDLAVLALPASVCETVPKRVDWRPRALEVANEAESWIAIAAIAEIAPAADVDALRTLARTKLRDSVLVLGADWPPAIVKLPDAIPARQLAALGLGELAQLAAMRPGDVELWTSLAERFTKSGLPIGAEEVARIPTELSWPKPAVTVAPDQWPTVDVGDLPAPLVAVVRQGGAIPAKTAPRSDAERRASDAFFAKEPRLAEAETLARDACVKPSPDALNLLAAIRLADTAASRDALLQALAFSTQSAALEPNHPFARVNVVRAMQRLGWKEQVKSALEAMPAVSGAWQQREIERLSTWARE